jgi:hypothetical protein
VANVVYNGFKYNALGTEGSLSDYDINVALFSDSYTPDADDTTYTSISSDEASGTGYTAGGQTLSSKSFDTSGTAYYFDAADVTWTSSTITARYAVLYINDASSPGDDGLVCCIDFGSNRSSSSGAFTIEWSSSGIIVVA